MDRPSDAFDRLRAADPVDPARIPGAGSPEAARTLAWVLAQPRDSAPARRRRAGWFVVVAVLLGAAAWVVFGPVTDPVGTACYAAASLDADRVAAPSGAADVTVCVPFWVDGLLVNPEVGPAGSVPPLVACLSDSGGLAVFPRTEPNVCGRLGLASPDPGSLPDAEAVRALGDRLAAHFLEAGCQPLDAAAVDVRRILDEAGFADWTVEPGTPTPDRPCASFSLDSATETIHLVPMPDV